MGKTLRSYVIREVLGAFLGGLVLFTFILLVARILDLVELVIARGVPAHEVLRLFAYVLPSFLEVTIPMAALLGVVVAFARFSTDGELLALRGAGLSLWQLSRPVLAMGLIAAAFTLAVAGWARPWAQRHVAEAVYEIAKTRATAALRPRVFNSLVDGLVLYVERLDPLNVMQGVVLSDERDTERRTTVFAGSARMVAEESAKRVYLRLANGTSVTYHAARGSHDMTSFASLEVNLDLSQAVAALAGGERRPEQMYPGELLSARTTTHSAEQIFAARMELHRRLAFAAAAVLLAMMGVPLGSQPSRAVRSRGIAASVLVGLGYHVLFTAAVGLARRNLLDVALAMWMPNALVLAAVLAMLGRAAADRTPYPTAHVLVHALAPIRRLAPS